MLFPQSYNANQFWDLTVEVQLQAGENSIRFASEEQPDFNGVTYISERYPTLGLRSQWAPNLDRMTFTALHPDTSSAPTLSAGASSVAQGATVTASGTGFTPGEKVEFVLHSDPIVLGEASADAAGAVSATLTVPVSAPVGDHRLIATGAISQRSATTSLAVTAASAGGSGGGGTGGTGSGGTGGGASSGGAAPSGAGVSASGSLAMTGSTFAGFGGLLVGAAALAAGAALIARRRERASS